MKAIWIELAARDIGRANRFYSTVFGHDAGEILEDSGRAIVIIPGEPVVSLNQTAGFEPDGHGTLPYFDIEGSLAATITVVESAGGSVVEAITERPGYGFFAIVADTEGNHIYLHSATQ